VTQPHRAPSLTARVAATVVLAFVGVFVVLFVVLWQEALGRESGDVDSSLLMVAGSVARTLDRTDSDESARTAVLLFAEQPPPQLAQDEPPLHLLAQRVGGGALHAADAVQRVDLRSAPNGLSTQTHGSGEWRVYAATGQRWKVAVVDDGPARSRWIGWQLFIDLAKYLALALPIVLLPVWWMARATLKPLTSLSDAVAARAPLDTAPLPVTKRWRELLPLQEALNRLFERMAAGVAREKAFVHDAAHELRTPLAVISAQAHVLAASEGAARVQAQERLQAAVSRASHLTQQLLQLAQADAAARGGQREPVDLMNLARDAMSLLAERASAQGTEFELQGLDQAPLHSDPRALRSIIDNLLDNALRYGGAGGTVTVRVRPQGLTLELSVSDQGPGIPRGHQEQVFERFWRGAGNGQPGTGLGLAIVREAARSLGGDAKVTAGPPGATVTVWVG
jgi:two-component system, OmpR family, sensor histidine kinase QseC